MTRAHLLAELESAEDALTAAEADLARIRREEKRAAARVNIAALCAATLQRELERIDELPRVAALG